MSQQQDTTLRNRGKGSSSTPSKASSVASSTVSDVAKNVSKSAKKAKKNAKTAVAAQKAAEDNRMDFIDAVRGFAILAMVVVNYQTGPAVFKFLGHAEWMGVTYADYVFPILLFTMGVSIALSYRPSSSKSSPFWIIFRGIKLFALGAAVHLLYTPGVLEGNPQWEQFRIFGVLQRMAIVYTISALSYAFSQSVGNLIISGFLPLFAWHYLTYNYPLPANSAPAGSTPCPPGAQSKLQPPHCTAQSYFDRLLLGGTSHLHNNGTYDPEGTLSTLPALAAVWAGVCTGSALVHARTLGKSDLQYFLGSFLIVGHIISRAGHAFGAKGGMTFDEFPFLFDEKTTFYQPYSKKLYTPTFLLATTGAALILTALISLTSKSVSGWNTPLHAALRTVGRNPLAIYILSELAAAALKHVRGAYPVPLAPAIGAGWSTTTAVDASLWDVAYQWVDAAVQAGGELVPALKGWKRAPWVGLVWGLTWAFGVFVPVAKVLESVGLFLRM
ncbi:uncharacterized protein EV422DRAFT_509036 [Fimicolochytrium jonesii]|uniref:uncharacterized protein n=1 Tax=Fimicolochytrium jonesii TaxID=1396493 RepID=UPI0022FDCFF1|nr:uncharacterized protein EV422DRAFT_509036 [Fimicolochytrium jonesii]KAI8817462.1 hypothetical protein EV422DRAFT_509036 [Fimicolochytrium jonesii]